MIDSLFLSLIMVLVPAVEITEDLQIVSSPNIWGTETIASSSSNSTTMIDRQLFTIDEEEDGSISVYDRSNGTQIAGFNNVSEMLQGMPEVINDMTEYYADKNVTDIIVIR